MWRLLLWPLWLVLFASATLPTVVAIVGSLLIVLFWPTLVPTALTMRLGHVRSAAPTNPTERHPCLLERGLEELRVELTAD